MSGTSEPATEPLVVARDDRHFWDGVTERKLLIQRCTSCGVLRHPPAPMCGGCGSLVWDTVESAGRGRVLTWILARHPNEPDAPARVVVLVRLDEGVRMVSNLVDVGDDDPYAGYDDLRVRVDFRPHDGVMLFVFRPEAEA